MSGHSKAVRHRGVAVRKRHNPGGSVSYRVECPISWFNRTTFRQFKTKEGARKFIDSQLDQTVNFGRLANLLTAEQRLDAYNAYERLNELNISLVECVDFYRKHAEPTAGNSTVSELIAVDLKDSQKGKGTRNGRPLRERSMRDLKNRLEKFAVKFGASKLAEVTPAEIESWIHREEWSFQTRRNYYRT